MCSTSTLWGWENLCVLILCCVVWVRERFNDAHCRRFVVKFVFCRLCTLFEVDELVNIVYHPLHELHFRCPDTALIGDVELSIGS
jgi:hypothetical protein